MSLLDDLNNLDLSQITSARAAISASVNDDGFQLALDGDLTELAFGELATLAQKLTEFNPSGFHQAWEERLGSLLKKIRIENVPHAKVLQLFEMGLELGSAFLKQIVEDPLSFGSQFGVPIQDILNQFANASKNVVNLPLEDIQASRTLWQNLELGLPKHASALAKEALGILFPFPQDASEKLRQKLDQISKSLEQPLLSNQIIQPLQASLHKIRTLAEEGNQAALDQALNAHTTIFAELKSQLDLACTALPTKLSALNLSEITKPCQTLFRLAKTGKPNGISFLNEFKHELIQIENLIALADEDKARQVLGLINQQLDAMNAYLKSAYLERIDAGIDSLKTWVRNLFKPLGLQEVEAEMDAFFANLTQTLNQINLRKYLAEIRNPIKHLRSQLETLNLGEFLTQRLTNGSNSVGAALATITHQLTAIDTALGTLTLDIQAIFEKVATPLIAFSTQIQNAIDAFEDLDVEGATDQVVRTLQAIRAKGEALFRIAPLPESMKPVIQQLIDDVARMDLDALITVPAQAAAKTLDIPQEVKAPLLEVLPKLESLLDQVHPDRLIAGLQDDIEEHLKTITRQAQSSMQEAIDAFFAQVQEGLQTIDPLHLESLLQPAFQKVLRLFDNLDPHQLLKPATDAYDAFLGQLDFIDPASSAIAAQSAIGAAGKAFGQAATLPLKALTSPGVIRENGSSQDTPFQASLDLKPGDLIRNLLGLPLVKLKQAIENLENSQLADFLAYFHQHSLGLANDLKSMLAKVGTLSDVLDNQCAAWLITLEDAQFDATFSIQNQIRLGHLSAQTNLAPLKTSSITSLAVHLRTNLSKQKPLIAQTVHQELQEWGHLAQGIINLLGDHPISLLSQNAQTLLNAIDPEPVAQALDNLAGAATGKFIELSSLLNEELKHVFVRAQQMVHQYNPSLHLQRLVEVLEVFWEEMALFNPHHWAERLSKLHQRIRSHLNSLNPSIWLAALSSDLNELAESVAQIDTNNILDSNLLNPFLEAADSAALVNVQSLGADLKRVLGEMGDNLKSLNPNALLTSLEQLKTQSLDELGPNVKAIQEEILKLLASLRFASTTVSANASVSI